jgi:3-hydroxybutyryl-CoA dehydrogenase
VNIVAVVGAGTMGSGIAQSFAQAGFDVRLIDVSPAMLDRAKSTIDRSLAKFVERGKLSERDKDAVFARMSTHATLSAASGADFIVEAIVEDAAAKRALFSELDQIAPPHVVLASNTSSIPIGTLASATTRPDRVLGMHFMNPVPLMVLVEVIRGAQTSDAAMRVAFDLCKALGKTAVESADRPGFIANRVLMPMINEAIYAVMEGVGTPEAVDTVMKLGMNHPMGPLTLADFIGLDVCLAIMRVLRDGFGDAKYTPCPLLERMVADGKLGRKAGQGFYHYA